MDGEKVTRLQVRPGRAVPLGLLLAGGAVLALSTGAAAAGSVTVSPNTGLTGGESVAVSGTGFTPSQPGNVLECNNAPNEPTVALGSPVSSSVPVGCTGPSLTALVGTSSSGAVSKTFNVLSGTLGPPCAGTNDVISTCPATDSAGQNPKTDAANFPCPPTAAQQAAGVTCVLIYGDQTGESAQDTILFQGESAPGPTTPTTTAATTATTAAPATTAPATSPSTSALAVTGPGPALWAVLLAAVVLLAASVLLGLSAPRSSRR